MYKTEKLENGNLPFGFKDGYNNVYMGDNIYKLIEDMDREEIEDLCNNWKKSYDLCWEDAITGDEIDYKRLEKSPEYARELLQQFDEHMDAVFENNIGENMFILAVKQDYKDWDVAYNNNGEPMTEEDLFLMIKEKEVEELTGKLLNNKTERKVSKI